MEETSVKPDPSQNRHNDARPVTTSSRAVVLSGLALFVLLFVAGGAWATYASLSGAVIAPGQVAVLGKPKTVQHLDGGIVAEIAVDNGDTVKKGDLLVRLDDTLLKANQAIYRNRLTEALARRARLAAERDDTEAIDWEHPAMDLFGLELPEGAQASQARLFETRSKTLSGQTSQLREKIAQYENQAKGIRALKGSKTKQLDLLEEELEGIRSLAEQGLTRKSQLMGLERQREEIIGETAEDDAELARIANAVSETEIAILQAGREFQEAVLDELAKTEAEINDMTEQLHATMEQLKRIDIRAPVAGIVHELSVFTIGGVIGPGSPILQIVPQDDGFEIEANIAPQFVDELYPGQPATLRFSAFNQRTTPELAGALKTISPNVIVNEQTGLSFYQVRLTVSDTELARLEGQAILPGMPVEAFIRTRDRTPLNYLLKPLTDQIKRAFKEE